MKNFLILAQEPPVELVDYLKNKDYQLFNPKEIVDHKKIDYIIIDSEESIKEVSQAYDADKNEIEIICLGEVYDHKTFFTFNGRFNIDVGFFSKKIGISILDKYFSSEYSLHLEENFNGNIENIQNVKITNHLSSGLYLDELSVYSFEAGFNLISIRSYMDHVLSYFTYLKQANLAGVPYEIEYGHNDEFFIVNTYLTVRDFVAEYMIDSFGKVNSKDPMKYLLGVSAQAADFMEVTYFENPGRLALTAMWSKADVKLCSSVAFHNVKSYAYKRNQLAQKIRDYSNVEYHLDSLAEKQADMIDNDLPGGIKEISERHIGASSIFKNKKEIDLLVGKIISETQMKGASVDDLKPVDVRNILNKIEQTDFVKNISNSDIEMILEKIQTKNILQIAEEEETRIRDEIKDNETIRQDFNESINSEVAQKLTSKLDVDVINKILSHEDRTEDPIILKGEKEATAFVQTIKGNKNENVKELVRNIKNDFEDLKDDFKKTFTQDIASKDKIMKVRSLIENGATRKSSSESISSYIHSILPREVELGLEKYASKVNKDLNELSSEEIDDFYTVELPVIIDSLVERDDLIDEHAQNIESNYQVDGAIENFDKNFKERFRQTLVDKKISSEEVSKEVVAEILKDSLSEVFSLENISLSEVENKEKLLLRSLTHTFGDNNGIEEIVGAVFEKTKKKEEEEVHKRLKAKDSLNKSNEFGESFDESELIKAIKEKDEELKKIALRNKLLESRLSSNIATQNRVNKIQERVNEQVEADLKDSNQSDKNDLNSEDMKIQIKKMEHEIRHKDTLFSSEISKIERVSKGKDIVLDKTKTALSSMIKQKESENIELQSKVEVLTQRLSSDQTTVLKKQLQDLQKENELLSKSSDMFRSRLEGLSKMNKAKDEKTDVEKTIESNRVLKLETTQLNNKVGAFEREIKTWETRLVKSQESEQRLRGEVSNLKSSLSEKGEELISLRNSESKKAIELSDFEQKAADSQVNKEVLSLKGQNLQLQKKLKELMDKSRSSSNVGSKATNSMTAKEKLLEKEKKRLQAEVIKSKRDFDENRKLLMKFKGENTKLNNENSKYKKDVERLEKRMKVLASNRTKKAA